FVSSNRTGRLILRFVPLRFEGDHGMSQLRGSACRPWPCLLLLAALATPSSGALAASPKHVAPARKADGAAGFLRKAAALAEAKKAEAKQTAARKPGARKVEA